MNFKVKRHLGAFINLNFFEWARKQRAQDRSAHSIKAGIHEDLSTVQPPKWWKLARKKAINRGAHLQSLVIYIILLMPIPSMAVEKPDLVIEQTVQLLIDEFSNQRDLFEADRRKLFALVSRVAVPLFDFKRISKLVLAKNWKRASEQQRTEFEEEFRKLLIGTYAAALFQYTGNETVTFMGSTITERKGRKFAKVKSEVTLSGGSPIPVEYSLILGKDGRWKIYNLSINDLNMITNYRETYSAAISSQGIDGLIKSMKQSNAKNF